MKKLKIGISMRTANASNYDEKRDAIARDWSLYMQNTWSEVQWMLIPNIGDKVVDYLKKWEINAIILSGGEDFGIDNLRDETEKEMYFFALKNNLPLLGVCRGFQIICHINNIELKRSQSITFIHLATTHEVTFRGETFIVNSYHSNYLDDFSKAELCFDEIGIAGDKTIEAVIKQNIMGIMWHPERKNKSQIAIDIMLKNFFYGTKN